MMVAEPDARIVQGNEKQIVLPDLVQQLLAGRVAGDGTAQRGAEPVQDRGTQEKLALIIWQRVQNLFSKVVQDVLVAACESLNDRLRSGLSFQSQGSKVQADDPPLCVLI